MGDGVPATFTELTTILGLVIGCVGVASFFVKVLQDKRSFRREQAASARTLIKEIFDTPVAMDALNLLDYDSYFYQLGPHKSVKIDRMSLLHGLRTSDIASLSDIDVFVRNAFDALLLKMESTVALLTVHYICWDDVEALLGYYIFMVRSDDALLSNLSAYAAWYGFPRAASAFLDRASFPTRRFQGAVRGSNP